MFQKQLRFEVFEDYFVLQRSLGKYFLGAANLEDYLQKVMERWIVHAHSAYLLPFVVYLNYK